MPAQKMTPLTPLPVPPNRRTDPPAVFSEKVQATVDAEKKMVDEFNQHIIPGYNSTVDPMNQVLANIADISTVAGIATDVPRVAQSANAIDRVHVSVAAVDTTAANMDAVIAAPTHAADAKYWAEQAEAIADIGPATEAKSGIIRIATPAEADAGTSVDTAVTPALLLASMQYLVKITGFFGPDVAPVGHPTTFTLSATSALVGGIVVSFIVSGPGMAEQTLPATSQGGIGTATVGYTVPMGTPAGQSLTLTAVAVDNSGYKSATVNKTVTAVQAYVVAPSVTSPIAGATVGATDIAIQSTAFSAVGGDDTHAASYWFIYGDEDKTQILWSSGRDTVNLTSITANPVPILPANAPAWICVSHEGASLGKSVESALVGVAVGGVVAPVITSPKQGEYKTAGNVTITGTPFASLTPADTQKAIHGKVVLASDPTVVRWEGSVPGVITQITASWTPEGDGQEDLLCSLAYEGYYGGMGAWAEPVLVRLVKSGVSIPVITWPLAGENYADPIKLRVNAEQPIIKSDSWAGTEWQVGSSADFSTIIAAQTYTDTVVLPNRVLVDLTLDGMLKRVAYLRCRHLTTIGPTAWSDTVSFHTALHQTFWEFTSSTTFTAPEAGIYEVLCVGNGGKGGKGGTGTGGTGSAGGGGGGSGYLSIGRLFFTKGQDVSLTIDANATTVLSIVALAGFSSLDVTGSTYGSAGGRGGSGGGAGGSGIGGGGGGSNGGSGGHGYGGTGGVGGGGGGQGGDGTQRGGGQGGEYNGGHGGPSSSVANTLTDNMCTTGYGAGGPGGSSNIYKYLGGGGAGYGGGAFFDVAVGYYSKHLPYKKFLTRKSEPTGNTGGQVGLPGYIRIIYKGLEGSGV